MSNRHIKYGIDLGTTNSAIFKIEKGEPQIVKIEVTDDIMPSCVAFNKKGAILVGKTAYNALSSDRRKSLIHKTLSVSNSFIEFKRTMGLDTTYTSPYANRTFTSEDLSSEVLKKIKSFVSVEKISAAVITVPAKFTINQKDATRRAATLAGIEHCELLQEPIAASMAYGLHTKCEKGVWLVFDFGGGTFDAALLKVEDGIMQVVDTDGDNYLGGQNLDYAIVDDLLMPYLDGHYDISRLLNIPKSKEALRESMKTYAEPIKNALSFQNQVDLITDLDDIGMDDSGEDMEIDIQISVDQLEVIIKPIFQKSIDICLDILQRNNIAREMVDVIIPVGGPTYSPILRRMICAQISDKLDTSIDPMTIVARGASLYASTISIDIPACETDPDSIMLDVSYEPTTVENEEWVTLKQISRIEEKIYVELTRSDKGWSSGRIEVDHIGEVIGVILLEARANNFAVDAYDTMGNHVSCMPSEITIIQGAKVGSSTLPYSIGIEVIQKNVQKNNARAVFSSIRGLEKNLPLPAVGVKNGLKTSADLRPGVRTDVIKIPLYQGDQGAEGVRAIYYELINEVMITGADVPSFIPSGSDVDLTVKIDRSERVELNIYFPSIDYNQKIEFDSTVVQSTISEKNLQQLIQQAAQDLRELQLDKPTSEALGADLGEVQKEFDNGSQRKQVQQHLKEILRKIDHMTMKGEWAVLEKELLKKLLLLEANDQEHGGCHSSTVLKIRQQTEEAIQLKDENLAKDLLIKINDLDFTIAELKYYVAYIMVCEEEFNKKHWKDLSRAKQLIDQGTALIRANSSAQTLKPIVQALFRLLPRAEMSTGAQGLLIER